MHSYVTYVLVFILIASLSFHLRTCTVHPYVSTNSGNSQGISMSDCGILGMLDYPCNLIQFGVFQSSEAKKVLNIPSGKLT